MTIRAACRQQARACAALGSPFTARLLTLAADRLSAGTNVSDRLLDWQGDITGGGASVPLRLAGALHALVLGGGAPALGAAWPPAATGDDDVLWAAVEQAFTEHEAALMRWLDSPPQTNEVRRAAALIAAAHLVARAYPLPLRLSELGASAGLNLHFDRFALALPDGTQRGARASSLTLRPDWRGPLPPDSKLKVMDRRGVDLNPLDPNDPSDILRLKAYTWPDQPDRMARLDAALALAQPVVDQGDAAAWLSQRLADTSAQRIDFVFHTIAWQYFPEATKAACTRALTARGAAATPENPLAWIGVEGDDSGQDGAAITLRLWPDDLRVELGRMDFHGRWVTWQDVNITPV